MIGREEIDCGTAPHRRCNPLAKYIRYEAAAKRQATGRSFRIDFVVWQTAKDESGIQLRRVHDRSSRRLHKRAKSIGQE